MRKTEKLQLFFVVAAKLSRCHCLPKIRPHLINAAVRATTRSEALFFQVLAEEFAGLRCTSACCSELLNWASGSAVRLRYLACRVDRFRSTGKDLHALALQI
jgi:hypothetical protein